MIALAAFGAALRLRAGGRDGAAGDREPGRVGRPLWAGAVAFGLAYPVAEWAVIPDLRFWHTSVAYRLPEMAAVGMGAGLLAVALGSGGAGATAGRIAVRAAALGFVAWTILSGLHPHRLGAAGLWSAAVGVGLAGAALLEIQDAGLGRVPRAAAAVHLLILAIALPPALYLGTLASVALPAASLAVVAGAALCFPGVGLVRGGTTAFGALVAAFLLLAVGFARLPPAAGVLLAGAVGAPAGAFLPPLRRSRRLAAAAVVLATGLAAGAGVAVAWSARQERLGAHAAEPAAQDRAAAAGDVHSRHGA